jgi:uncharacterized LabA/DUF88 family protein
MKIVWLIDMGYLTKASKGRGKVDYIATKKFLENKFKLECLPIIFNSVDSYGVDLGLKQFYYTVKNAGFVVNLYKMEGGHQKQVDVAIASHLVYHSLKGDVIVLSSGDIDFLPAIELVKKENAGQRIIMLTFKAGVHESLIDISEQQIYFEDHPDTVRR